MIDYAVNHFDKLGIALLEHLEMLVVTILISIVLSSIFTIAAMSSKILSYVLIPIILGDLFDPESGAFSFIDSSYRLR
ncbi:hypothetical protein [Paenibacillus sp. Soil766]|uniref:hypothetical protein n=1 Tax=Paenibacillus sp. Soil766 TaxID=1736404 RepID=UPI000B10277B|nr:hypothetical protein [Paenibacillus sp. Soil766]